MNRKPRAQSPCMHWERMHLNATDKAAPIPSTSTAISNIPVFDMKGQKVKTSSDGMKPAYITFEKLPVGSYIFRVNNILSEGYN